jgi:hypothetical protein
VLLPHMFHISHYVTNGIKDLVITQDMVLDPKELYFP